MKMISNIFIYYFGLLEYDWCILTTYSSTRNVTCNNWFECIFVRHVFLNLKKNMSRTINLNKSLIGFIVTLISHDKSNYISNVIILLWIVYSIDWSTSLYCIRCKIHHWYRYLCYEKKVNNDALNVSSYPI